MRTAEPRLGRQLLGAVESPHWYLFAQLCYYVTLNCPQNIFYFSVIRFVFAIKCPSSFVDIVF